MNSCQDLYGAVRRRDDPPPAVPILQAIIECYRRESYARTSYLTSCVSDFAFPGRSQRQGPIQLARQLGNPLLSLLIPAS